MLATCETFLMEASFETIWRDCGLSILVWVIPAIMMWACFIQCPNHGKPEMGLFGFVIFGVPSLLGAFYFPFFLPSRGTAVLIGPAGFFLIAFSIKGLIYVFFQRKRRPAW